MDANWPKPRYSWYVVVTLTLAYVLSYLDRTIMSIVIEPVKRDLALSDTQISLLIGFAFAAFYALAGIPFGLMADRLNRTRIIAAGVAAWSVMTALTGWCGSFATLFLARMGVGVGEAALYPSALSMIGDYFAPMRRHLAIAVFAMGGTLGVALAYAGGGAAVALGSRFVAAGTELFGTHSDWQWAFILVGLPGILILLLLTAVREPLRRGVLTTGAEGAAATGAPSIQAVLHFSRQHWKTFACLFGGASLMVFTGFGYMLWGVSLFVRVHGWTPTETAGVFGPSVLLIGLGGNLLAGALSRGLSKRGYTDAVLRAGVILGSTAILPIVIGTLMPNPWLVVAIAFPGLGIVTGISTLGLIGIQTIVPNQMRGQFNAVYAMVIAFIGMGLGPTFIALLTDYVYRNEASLHYSIATASALVLPLGVLLFVIGMKHMRRSALEARAWAES